MEDEELEVDKLSVQEAASQHGELFDSLYQNAQINDQADKRIEEEKKQEEEDESVTSNDEDGDSNNPSPDEDTDLDLSGNQDNPDETESGKKSDESPAPGAEEDKGKETKAESPEKGEKGEPKPEDTSKKDDDTKVKEPTKTDETVTAATESCIDLHKDALRELRDLSFGMESVSDWVRNNRLGERAVEKLSQGGKALGEMGRKSFKAAGGAIKGTLKAMVKGTLAITKFIKSRLESYQAYQSKLNNAKKYLADLETDKIKEGGIEDKDHELVRRIKVDKTFDPIKGAETINAFMADYYGSLKENVLPFAKALEYLVSEALRDRIATPKLGKSGQDLFKGLTDYPLNDYKPESEELGVFQYAKTLPGDVLFMAFLPDSREARPETFIGAKTFFGLNTRTADKEVTAAYLTKDELGRLLDALGKICEQGLQAQGVVRDIQKHREQIQKLLDSFDKKFFKEEVDEEVGKRVTSFVTPYLAFFDRICISGPVAVDEYAQRYLHASVEFFSHNT
jgi:hypothetical protein